MNLASNSLDPGVGAKLRSKGCEDGTLVQSVDFQEDEIAGKGKGCGVQEAAS